VGPHRSAAEILKEVRDSAFNVDGEGEEEEEEGEWEYEEEGADPGAGQEKEYGQLEGDRDGGGREDALEQGEDHKSSTATRVEEFEPTPGTEVLLIVMSRPVPVRSTLGLLYIYSHFRFAPSRCGSHTKATGSRRQ